MSEPFGTFEGHDVRRITISDGSLTAKVMEWGAVVQDLRLEGHDAPLVLGFETFDPYPEHSPYFGAVPGRVANRIRNARAPLEGRTIELDANQNGRHHLHGGAEGLGRRLWKLVDHGPAHATLRIISLAGDMGYPGTLTALCNYVIEGAALHVTLTATTDAPTFVNLTHHGYFNLHDGGATDVLDHSLSIDADAYLAIDADAVAGGEPLSVQGTRFDWRDPQPVRRGIDDADEMPVWDHNYCLSDQRVPMREVATLASPDGSLAMTVATTEPGLQFYDGAKIDVPVPGLDGIAYGARSGLCLETQAWPDAPNNPDYPSILLHPGNTREQKTVFSFHRAANSP